jgi:hypothetical protein
MITSPPITVQHLEALLSRYATARGPTALARAGGFRDAAQQLQRGVGCSVTQALPHPGQCMAGLRSRCRGCVAGRSRGAPAARRAVRRAARSDLAGPGIRPFKGDVIAALYPPGWVRRSGDLDIEVSTLAEALVVGRYLQDSGWTVIRLSLFQADGSPRIALNLVDLRSVGALVDYDRLHLQGFAFRGEIWGLPPRLDKHWSVQWPATAVLPEAH